MVSIIESGTPLFDAQTARRFFEANREDLDDQNGFDVLLTAGRFFNVYQDGYIGSVFVYQGTDERFYIGGYAKRHHHHEVVAAIKAVAAKYPLLHAHTRHKNAVLALKKAGFDWFDRAQQLLYKINKE
jgi:hypothetical protein